METKQFPLRVVLSVTTGRLLTGIGDLYYILGWMTNDEPFTHEVPRFMKECAPWLLRWFPGLGNVDLPSLDRDITTHGPERGVELWLSNLFAFQGIHQSYDVPRIPADDHDRKNPVAELEAMVGKDRVIVVHEAE